MSEEMVADQVAMVKPLEERILGNSARRLELHFGVESRAAWGPKGIREELRTMAGEPGAELQKTFWLAILSRRKYVQRIGTETRASLNGQSKQNIPNQRGMILEPEQEREELSTVRSLIWMVEVEDGAGKTETETLGSNSNQCQVSTSLRYSREELVELAGRASC